MSGPLALSLAITLPCCILIGCCAVRACVVPMLTDLPLCDPSAARHPNQTDKIIYKTNHKPQITNTFPQRSAEPISIKWCMYNTCLNTTQAKEHEIGINSVTTPQHEQIIRDPFPLAQSKQN